MINPNSEDWRTVTEWASGERARLIQRICTPITEHETATIRGQIALIDALLALPDQGKEQLEPELFGAAPPG